MRCWALVSLLSVVSAFALADPAPPSPPWNAVNPVGGGSPAKDRAGNPLPSFTLLADCQLALQNTQAVGTYKCVQPAQSVDVVVGTMNMTAQIYVNTAKIPAPAVGASTDKFGAQQFPPFSNDGTGDFRTACAWSHMSNNDPIVYPGQPGRSHLHTFAGNTGTNADSNATTIATTGNSTCRGGTLNRTAYWFPTMIDTLDGTPIAPDSIGVYYKSDYDGVKPSQINPMPAGLRMIAGNPAASTFGPWWGPTRFTCLPLTPAGSQGWTSELRLDCPIGSSLQQTVSFPQCWDGLNLDSPDHRSHMTYSVVGVGCPATHPIALPKVTLNVIYAVTTATPRWRLSSDAYDHTLPAGASSHADWFNGWKPDIMQTWATKCVQAGKDCASHMLGDGRTMDTATVR